MTSDVRLAGVLGLPVVLRGRMIGRVERAVVTTDGRCLRGLMVRRGLGGAKWVEARRIVVLGEVSVVIDEGPERLPRDADFSLRTVKDTGGMTLGWVTDVLLNPVTYRVTGLELTLGLVEELMGGRLIARSWAVVPGTGQVLVPCGYALETARGTELTAQRR
ncbi:MAG: hypothetical protein J1E43_07450 [Christensenellaceae bacterium]|nr:hypothetical protein [Christensenellaceae bacterium]